MVTSSGRWYRVHRHVRTQHRVHRILGATQIALGASRPRSFAQLAQSALRRRAAVGRRRRAPRCASSAEQLASLRTSNLPRLVLQRAAEAGTARPLPGADTPRSPGAAPCECGSMSRSEGVGDTRAAGHVGEFWLARVGRVARRPGIGEVGVELPFGGPLAGRVGDDQRARRWRPGSRPRCTGANAARMLVSSVAAPAYTSRPSASTTATPVWLALTPGQVESDEVHGSTVP